MDTKRKAWAVSAAGLVGGTAVGGTILASLFRANTSNEGMFGDLAVALATMIGAMFGGCIGAPIGCYIALRMAKIPQPGLTTLKAVVITAVIVRLATGSLWTLDGFDFDGAWQAWVALGVAVTPVILIGKQRGWFRSSPR